jgi:uncharacterized protein YggE
MNEEKTLHISPPKHIEWAAVAALSMLGLFLLVETLTGLGEVGRPQTPAMNTVTVSGTGSVMAPPDIAHVTFTVQHTAATVSDAQDATTKQANAAIEYVKGQGVAEKDVKTLSYSISPQYAYPNPCPAGSLCPQYYDNSPKITGYQVAETMQITVRNLIKVSTLLAGLGKQNVQNVNGPDFALDDPTSVQNQARTKAITDAKAQANELAKELGVRLVRIVNFSEGGNYPIYAMYGKGGGVSADSAPAPQIPVGENEYSSNVSITYEIR